MSWRRRDAAVHATPSSRSASTRPRSFAGSRPSSLPGERAPGYRVMKVLSIVIPAYNEERFIGELLEQIGRVDLIAARAREGSHRRRRLVPRPDGRDRRGGARRQGRAAARQRRQGNRRAHGRRAGDRGLPDHPGCGPRVRPARLRADAGCAARREGRRSLREPLPEGPDARSVLQPCSWSACRPVVAGLPGRPKPQPGGLGLHRHLSDGHRDSAEALPPAGARVTRSDDDRLRAGSRDHGEVPWRGASASSRCRSGTIRGAAPRAKKIGLRDWFTGTKTFLRYRRG